MTDDELTRPVKLFYSYSHTDEDLRERLVKHLSLLKRQGVIADWSDRKIEEGYEWAGEIDYSLKTAQVILLLISSDFLASDYCYDVEMRRAMERHESGEARVVPVILRPCDWENAPFGKLQALPRGARPVTLWANYDEAFENIARHIREVCRKLTEGRADDVKCEVPFKGEASAGPLKAQEVSPGRKPDGAQAPPRPGGEFRYSNLFQISSLTLPYVVLVGAWDKGCNEYRMAEVTSVTDAAAAYQLPDDFKSNPAPEFYFEDFKCRLTRYDCVIIQRGRTQLTFKFSKISYLDYLLSGEHLDDPLPGDPARTFRDEYAPGLEFSDLGQSRLTNICGVGIFVVTRDRKIIISKHSRSVKVYSDTWTYSASGTMDWGEQVHPFVEVARECVEEIGHRVNFDNTHLFAFGIDTKKLYYQFSFVEHTGLSSEEVMGKARMARDFHAEMEELVALPFELNAIVNAVKRNAWEPAAAACLLTLCAKEFGHGEVERAVDPAFVRTRVRNEMRAEWGQRASRPDELAVMSARYPFARCPEESDKYIRAVSDFIGVDADGKDVLEIGAGIGRLSEVLALRARKLTCLDLSSRMLDRNRARLGGLAAKVNYLHMFAQDYRPETAHEVVVSSLVLIHNVDDSDFRRLVDVMSMCAPTIFLFEHTDFGSQVSQHTRPRSAAELLSAFREYEVERRDDYRLFGYNLIFLKLVR